MSRDVRDVLRELAATDRRGAVWAAALCAASVLHLVPEGERRPAHAVRLARRWARGCEVTAEALEAAIGHVDGALRELRADAERRGLRPDAACYGAVASVQQSIFAALGRHVDHCAQAADLAMLSVHSGRWASRETHAAFGVLVAHHTAPVAPTLADVLRCRPRAAVVWDAADVAALGPVRLGTLGDALARATRGGWRWACPVERAIAERLDEAHPVLVRARRAA